MRWHPERPADLKLFLTGTCNTELANMKRSLSLCLFENPTLTSSLLRATIKVLTIGGERVSTGCGNPRLRAEVVRRPRKTPGKLKHANETPAYAMAA